MLDEIREQSWTGTATLESPFSESDTAAGEGPQEAEWGEASPFAEAMELSLPESERDQLLAEAFAELRDEAFDAAVAALAEETEQAVADRFTGESPAQSGERERFADNYLSSVRFEAERYLSALEAGMQGLDFESLSEEQLDAKLDQFDPQLTEVTPAGEEFIGGLIRKAKKAVKFVANAAKSVGGLAGKLLGPVLGKLKKLVEPLLKRVLQFAIGRLPAPLRPAARELAKRISLEAEEGEGESYEAVGEAEEGEELASPATITDPEMLAEEFDAALAEAFGTDPESPEAEQEEYYGEGEDAGRQLEQLAEARGQLIESLKSGDEETVGPAMEQFIPVLLGALRLGINLVGRPKVVGFLAQYLARLIGRWVGPQLSNPLSNAIVDTGLRLVSLEAEEGEAGLLASEAGPLALASVIEDTVRRVAEQESYVFETEELTELAAAEAFGEAVATHFPQQFVRPELRQAPSLGGTFVARRPRSVRAYRKYSRVPEIEITPQLADSLPSFGGRTVGGALRASGLQLPVMARMHIYQSAPGTTLPAIARTDRSLNSAGRGYVPSSSFHPLTPAAAGLLLREPRLGAATPSSFMRSPNRIAVGQRFYVLQPVGAGAPALPASRAGRATAARLAPSSTRVRIDRGRGRVTARFFFSEAEAQRIARLIREGRGHSGLLQALVAAWRSIDPGNAGPRVIGKQGEDFEELVPLARPSRSYQPGQHHHHHHHRARHHRGHHHGRLRRLIIPALARWAKYNAEAFARAAADPASGVTVLVQMGLPGAGGMIGSGLRALPAISISVVPGMQG